LLAGKELVQLPADNEILSTVMVELRQPLAYPGHARIGWRKSWETLPITEMKLSKNGSRAVIQILINSLTSHWPSHKEILAIQ
jgi:hypothetical protein